jgi:hypothetical protein
LKSFGFNIVRVFVLSELGQQRDNATNNKQQTTNNKQQTINNTVLMETKFESFNTFGE